MHKEQTHRWFPLFIDLEQWRILVIGGGNIAQRRIQTLLEFEPGHIQVVTRELEKGLEKWENLPNVSICTRSYQTSDLENFHMVLAATNDSALNERIWNECKKRGILVNIASDQNLCDFYFPSVAFNGPITVGINAAGKNHRLVKRTREQIQEYLCQGGKNVR